ncbi:MAG TPA: CotH kinase family protein, partial [Candidatus Saccharimonadales bacterium]|nr:CotH kinase family protein [Candidatus Saccharimonadales bacterium]
PAHGPNFWSPASRNGQSRARARRLGLGLLLCSLAAVFPAPTRAARPARSGSADELFTNGPVQRIRIEIAPAQLSRLRQHNRTYVPVTVREGDTVYTNVSLRLKGGPGSFRPLEDKPAFTVNFGRLAEGQKFHGLKKLHLNNSVQDSTYLSEMICREMFGAAGVPAPRAGHVVVEFNGRPLGLYVLVEGIDGQFLHRYFSDSKGNLYDGHSQSDVTHGLRLNSGDQPRDRSGLAALSAAAQISDLEQRRRALQKSLDLDRFLSFLATEVVTCHWDGYALNRNNYRIYTDRGEERMVFLPQGVDQTFQRQNIPPFPVMVGLVAKSVLEIPAERERYRARMLELLTNVFHGPAITHHLDEVAARLQPIVAEFDSEAGAAYLKKVAAFRRRIQQRLTSLTRQLSPAPALPSATFGAADVLALPDWNPKTDLGHPSLRRVSLGDGTLLQIATDDPGAGSWRTRVQLEPGKYRLEGKLKLDGVEFNQDDPRAGAGLRVSRRHFSRPLPAAGKWVTVPFDFDVTQEHAEVELVCELRADRGKAWFDLGSLRLLRRE